MAKKQVRKAAKKTARKKTFDDVVQSVTGAGFTATPFGGEELHQPFPAILVERLKEDARADRQSTVILKDVALRDLRAVRAAQHAYETKGHVIIAATSNAERRVIDQLVDNALRAERAAVIEIINEWQRAYTVTAGATPPNVRELKQLLLQVRGEADREVIDNTAVGQYEAPEEGEDSEAGDFLPFRQTVARRAWKPITELALAE